ncbi:MAG: KH domain-containing protein, partial [Bacilli bacterium]|nr:KH domain-containing protein [Bacilli bacterium]
MKVVEFTEYLVKSIVKEPEMVKVQSFNGDEGDLIIEIIVHENDMGAVIGKN